MNTLRSSLMTPCLLDSLKAYWMALGVSDANLALTLSEQTLRRLPDVLESVEEEESVARAIIAAGELLDDRLAAALGLPRPSSALLAARAALLSGVVPDWPSVLFAPPDMASSALDRLRAVTAEPTPLPSPGLMPVQRIEPVWKRSL